jgi:hypothetical protein
MSYKDRTRGRKGRLQARKEAAIQAVAAKRPPRVIYETKYEPARPPIAQTFSGREPGEKAALFELGKAPENRVIEVPVVPTGVEYEALRFVVNSNEPIRYPRTLPHVRTVRMQAEEWGCAVDNTRIRWWSWKPVGEDVTPEKANVMGRCMAYAHRVQTLMRELMHTDAQHDAATQLEQHEAFARSYVYGGRWGLQQLADWLKVVIEDVEQLRGMP